MGLAQTMVFGTGNPNVNQYYAGADTTPKRRVDCKQTMKPRNKVKSKKKKEDN